MAKLESSNLPPISLATVQARFTGASNLLLHKDRISDWRSCARFNVTSANVFTVSASRLDPADMNVTVEVNGVTTYPECDPHLNAADITFLDELDGAGGACWGNDWHRIIIQWDEFGAAAGVPNIPWLERAIAHEFGHGVGLHHEDHSAVEIMHGGRLTGAEEELSHADANAYDGQP